MACGGTSGRSYMDDVEFIRESINNEIEELARELLDKRYYRNLREAKDVAKRVLINRDQLPDDDIGDVKYNGPLGDSPIDRLINNHKKKIPEFLIVISLTEPEDSKRRENERKQRRLEAQSFLEQYGVGFELDELELGRQIVKEVKSFSRMLTVSKAFVRDSISELPIVIFLGHGGSGGLCFKDEKPEYEYVRVRKVLEDIDRTFEETRPKEMASSKLRLVFSQCFGHLADDKDNPGKVMAYGGIEYFYVTDSSNPRSRSIVRTDIPIIEQVGKVFDTKDIHLELPDHHLAIKEAVERLDKFMDTNKDHMPKLSPKPEDFRKWLRQGPPDNVPKTLQGEVQTLRKGLKVFLHLSCTGKLCGKLSPFKRDPYDCSTKYCKLSKTELIETISRFLREDAKNTAMPVILVEGEGSVNEEGSLVLHICGDRVPVVELHEKFRHVDQLRFVFYCQDNKLWFSNAKLPDVKNAYHAELEENYEAIIS